MKRENLIILLGDSIIDNGEYGDSIIDNGEYVGSGEPDVARQLQILLPHHMVAKRAVDGATSADILAWQIADVERAEHIILSAGGNDALEHVDLLDGAIEKRAQDVLVRLWSIREGFRRSYAALLDCLAITRRPVLVFTVYNPCFQGHGFDAAYQQAAESAVSILNDVIQQEGRRRSFDILELRTLFSDPADYANPIEPSAIGGAKLAKCMSDWGEIERTIGQKITEMLARDDCWINRMTMAERGTPASAQAVGSEEAPWAQPFRQVDLRRLTPPSVLRQAMSSADLRLMLPVPRPGTPAPRGSAGA